jgi:MFS family permease
LAQAGVGTLQGIGGTASATLAGVLAVRAGYSAAFLALAFIAFVGGVLFLLLMPETKHMSLTPVKDAAGSPST